MESPEATTIVSEAQSAGMSITAIAERVGCTRTTIYHWRDHDVKLGRALARALVELRAQVRRKK